MNKKIETLIFVLAFAGGGYLAGLTAGHRHTAQAAMASPATGSQQHKHGIVEIADQATAPGVQLTLQKDTASGWNLQLDTQNFRFAPEHAGQVHRPQEGHAHLYIDGRKTARIYGSWIHLPEFEPSAHEIIVTLNTNSHAAYVVDGKPVSARVIIDRQ